MEPNIDGRSGTNNPNTVGDESVKMQSNDEQCRTETQSFGGGGATGATHAMAATHAIAIMPIIAATDEDAATHRIAEAHDVAAANGSAAEYRRTA